jgi:6-phosphogluconolactonase
MSQLAFEGPQATWELPQSSAETQAASDPPTIQKTVTALYVSHAGDGMVCVLHLQADGRLTPAQRLPVGGLAPPMAVHPNGRSLYAARRSGPQALASLVTLAINPEDGCLVPVNEQTLPATLAQLSVCGTGRWLLAASEEGNWVAVCGITADGVPHPPHQIVHGIPKASCARMWRGQRSALVASMGADELLAYRFDGRRGKLDLATAQRSRLPFRSGPRQLQWHPSLDLAYLLNELDGQLHAFEVDGVNLRHRQQVSSLPTRRPEPGCSADLKVTPDGRFLFASERAGSTVASYGIHPSSGRLSLVGHWPVQQQPCALQVDPHSRYLLVAGQSSHQVGVHAIGDNGELTPLEQTAVGNHPSGMEILQLPAA